MSILQPANVATPLDAATGFAVHDSYGTYFLCADPRPLGYDDSTAFCAALPEKVGVAAIPMSAFCDPAAPHHDLWNHLVRFTFCKRDGTLDEATVADHVVIRALIWATHRRAAISCFGGHSTISVVPSVHVTVTMTRARPCTVPRRLIGVLSFDHVDGSPTD